MKVFLSWSGEKSRLVAELLKDWIPSVLQNAEPWVSTEDIDKGSIWFDTLANTLADVSVGIICLTRDNLTAPWLLFEAGALCKGLTKNRVCPLLVDLEVKDLVQPFAQFNAARAVKEDMLRLVRAINAVSKPEKPLADDRVKASFDRWWNDFDQRFKPIRDLAPKAPPAYKRDPEDKLDEMLALLRSLQQKAQAHEHHFALTGPGASEWTAILDTMEPGQSMNLSEFLDKAGKLKPVDLSPITAKSLKEPKV